MGIKSKTTLHLLGLPHTQTTLDTVACAFTAKLVKFAEMMQDDYNIVVYSGAHNDAPCVEHVQLFSDRDQRQWYGDLNPNTMPSLATWNAEDPHWVSFNERAIWMVQQRAAREDIVLILAGHAQKPVADALGRLGIQSCEWAAGYEGIFCPHVCFESHAWRHYLYGKLGLFEGRWTDTVIPNFFRPDDFQIASSKSDYLLYVGRLIRAKGINVAAEVAMERGVKLVLAGSGAKSWGDGYLETEDGTRLEGDLEYVGTVNAQERNKLMGEALAVLAPTTYIEPFGAVAIEAMLCGTPVITTPWGAFSETVSQEFRFADLSQAMACLDMAETVSPTELRASTLQLYSLEAIKPKYEEWFTRLSNLWEHGWYEKYVPSNMNLL